MGSAKTKMEQSVGETQSIFAVPSTTSFPQYPYKSSHLLSLANYNTIVKVSFSKESNRNSVKL